MPKHDDLFHYHAAFFQSDRAIKFGPPPKHENNGRPGLPSCIVAAIKLPQTEAQAQLFLHRGADRVHRVTVSRFLQISLSCAALLAVALLFALSTGAEPVQIWTAFLQPDSNEANILFGPRLPRILIGALVGGALAPAGVAFQALLRNPLADPYVLGVSGGASLAATLTIVIFGEVGVLGDLTRPFFAFAGAALTIFLVLLLGRVRGRLVPHVALLAGVVLNALSGALILAIRVMASPNAELGALHWLTGSLAGSVNEICLAMLSLCIGGGLFVLARHATAMNAFAMGDEVAHVVGIATERARLHVFLAASLLTGAAVAVAGPIGFVGIIVPHVLRLLLGPDHRILLVASALVGSAFLVSVDAVTRLSLRYIGTEPPVGILTALVGAPCFLLLLRRRGERSLF
jgi:iron complex transport system permease protein